MGPKKCDSTEESLLRVGPGVRLESRSGEPVRSPKNISVLEVMCKKQTSVSRSSTESEIISLDAGLRLDGIPALDVWDLIVLLLGNTTQNHDRTGKPVVCRGKNHVRHQSRGVINVLDNVDLVPSNVRFSHQEALCLKTTKQ